MQKKLEYILNKRLTVKGETLSVEKIRTLEHFLSYLRNVSIVFRCLGDDYLQKQYNTSKDNIGLLSEYIFPHRRDSPHCVKKEFVDGLLSMRMNFIHTGYDKELWKRIIDFTDYPKNRYITESLNETFETFVKEVCIMKRSLGFITFPSHDWQCLDPLVNHTQDEIDNNLKEELFGLPNDIFKEDIPGDNDSYWDRICKNQIEIKKLVDNVLKAYQHFRDSVKKYLFV